MARIRTIKPDFWTDLTVGECSVRARLLFVATWNFADDHGGLDRPAKQLKAQAFPYDDFDCEPLIQELLNVGLLIEYQAGGKYYLHIKNFQKHQKVEKPAKARIPLYEESMKTPRLLPDSSPTSNGSSLGSNPKSKSKTQSQEGEGDRSAEGRTQPEIIVGPVERVFDYWRAEYRRPKTTLDVKRRRIITAALKQFDEATLKAAIVGYKNSVHHMGGGSDGTVYNDISLFLRDAQHIEAGLQFGERGAVLPLSQVEIVRQHLRDTINGSRHADIPDGSDEIESSGSLEPAAGLFR